MKVELIGDVPMLTGDWVHTLQDRARERYSQRRLPAGRYLSASSGAGGPVPQDAEWLRWVACLDGLLSLSRVGGDEVERRLGLAKLHFLQRRAQWLHERVLARGQLSARAGMEELQLLLRELNQVLMELSGREALPVDEWPFPYRLFSRRQPLAQVMLFPPVSRRAGERRSVGRLSGNMLRDEERRVAEAVLNQLSYTVSVMGQAFARPKHPLMKVLRDLDEQLRELLRVVAA